MFILKLFTSGVFYVIFLIDPRDHFPANHLTEVIVKHRRLKEATLLGFFFGILGGIYVMANYGIIYGLIGFILVWALFTILEYFVILPAPGDR